jgi:hypothetical protein
LSKRALVCRLRTIVTFCVAILFQTGREHHPGDE